MNSAATVFACVLPGLLVAHQVADHWVQTDYQAATKGRRGSFGRMACASHVATYTAVTAGMTGLLWVVLDLPVTPLGFLLGQAVSAVTHYWADRRFALAALCDRLGKGEFYRLGTPRQVLAYTRAGEAVELRRTDGPGGPGPWDNPSPGTGAYALDQSWHWFWLGVSAFIIALV